MAPWIKSDQISTETWRTICCRPGWISAIVSTQRLVDRSKRRCQCSGIASQMLIPAPITPSLLLSPRSCSFGKGYEHVLPLPGSQRVRTTPCNDVIILHAMSWIMPRDNRRQGSWAAFHILLSLASSQPFGRENLMLSSCANIAVRNKLWVRMEWCPLSSLKFPGYCKLPRHRSHADWFITIYCIENLPGFESKLRSGYFPSFRTIS